MKKVLTSAGLVFVMFAMCPGTHAWISYLDGSSLPGSPWDPFVNEGMTTIVDIGGGNMALRMDSPAHMDASGTHYNEYYSGTTGFGATELVGASRFRLVSFSPTGKENLLSVTVGGATPTAPSITLVEGNFWVWSYTTDAPIFDLGPAVANEFHEAYILARNNGTAQVWWDGAFVVDGPVPLGQNLDGYVEFGSGTYWQTTAATVVDFDWVGYGDATDMIPEPGSFLLLGTGLLGLLGLARFRK